MVARCRRHSSFGAISILVNCAFSGLLFLQISIVPGSTHVQPPGRIPSHVGRQDRDMNPNDVAFTAFKQAVLLARTDVGALISLEKSEPVITSRSDHSADASGSTLGDACHTSRLSPSRLESHDAEAGHVEVGEASLGCSAGNQRVPFCPRSTAEMPGEQEGQGVVAEESKRIACSTEPFATRDVLGEIACKGQVQVPGSCAEGEQTTMNGDGKRSFQESHDMQKLLRGAVDAIEATALDTPEAPAWRDLDVCVAPRMWDAHAGKDAGGSSNAGGPNAAPGPPNEGSGAVIEMEPERKPRKQGAHYCTGSLSCPEYASDHFNVPGVVLEQEAPERRGPRVKGVGTNIAATETDRIDGGDAAVLESHDAEAGDVEVDEAALGCSAGNQRVPSCPRSTAEMPGEQEGQGVVAEESKRIARSTEPFATRDVSGEIACKGQVQVPGSFAEGEQTTMNGDGKRSSQESHDMQEVLRGAVDAIEATALDTPEAPAWRDLDVCVAPRMWDAHAGKDAGGSSNAGGPNAAPGPPNEGSGAVIEMEPERKPRKQGAHYCTGSLSCPEYASDHFNVPGVVPERKAPERRGPRVKGVGTNIAAIETDRIDGGDAAVLESHDAEAGDVEVDEAALGCSAGNQRVPSCPRSTAEMPGEQEGQGVVAEESKRIACSTEPFATRDVSGEIACKGQVQVPGSFAEGEQTTMNGDGKQEVLRGAVDAVEATALDTPEAPAWRDLDVCVAPRMWDAHAGKDAGGSSNAGGPNAAPGPPNEGSGVVIEMEPERKSRKQGAHYCTGSLSCPEYASDHFNVPGVVLEQEAPERRGPRVKGVGTNIAAIETDRTDGGDAAVNLAGELVVAENVSVGAGRLPWALWVCAMLLCVVLISYECVQGNLTRWVPFMRGGPREGWAVDFDNAIAAARSRAGSLGSGKPNSTAEVNDDLGIPDLVSEDEPLPVSGARREDVAPGRPAMQACGSEDLMWDTRPKPFDHLVFDPVLGVVPWGVLDAWARASREGAGASGEGDAFTNRCSSVSTSATEDDVDNPSASPRGVCCGKAPSRGRRGHQKRALPPVRYTPEWNVWKAARASSKRTESADRVGSGGETGSEGSRPRSVNGGEAGAAVAAGAVAFGKNGSPVGAKIRMPKAIGSELEDAVAGGRGGIEYADVSADACSGNPLEISKVRDDTTSSEWYLARLSSASREVSPIRPPVQPCV